MTAIVKVILRNEVYCGILRMNYSGTRSYKNRTMTGKPESEWIQHEGLHEAIVSTDVWNAVQKINEDTRRRFENRQASQQKLFSRKLICADCKSPLACLASKHRLKNGCVHQYISYVCSLHINSGKAACSWHRVNENTLAQIVIAEIQAHAQEVALDEEAVADRLKRHMAEYDAQRLVHARQEIRQLRLRIEKLEGVIAKLYEDKISGAISENTALVLMQKKMNRSGSPKRNSCKRF